MHFGQLTKAFILVAGLMALSACGGGGLFGNRAAADAEAQPRVQANVEEERETIWDLFRYADDPNVTVAVNKYLWEATFDILAFLPVQAADPFTGVILFGSGTPPGGGRAYSGTVTISDPALDARALNVALRTSGGAISADTQRAIEDAILTRARQLRIADGNL